MTPMNPQEHIKPVGVPQHSGTTSAPIIVCFTSNNLEVSRGEKPPHSNQKEGLVENAT
ncbi:MAG: hypothetical protein QXN15_05780 [Candidatus Jordarchaeales archaeon]|nr:hypothetical protein [Candidatus Jordarchaeia archaeon]